MINVIGLGPGNTDYITKLGEKLIQNSTKKRSDALIMRVKKAKL